MQPPLMHAITSLYNPKTRTVTILYLLFCFNIVTNDDLVNHVMWFRTWTETRSDQVLKTFWMN